MPHLCRAEAVEQLDAKRIHPTLIQLRGQRFAGRGRETQALEIGTRGRCARQHLLNHRGDVDQNGRPMPADVLQEDLRRRALRKEHARGAHRKGKEDVRAGGVSKEELRDRNRDVIGADAKHALAVERRRVGEGAMRLHDSLRRSRRAAAEQPDCGVVPVRIERRERRDRSGEPRVELEAPDGIEVHPAAG